MEGKERTAEGERGDTEGKRERSHLKGEGKVGV